MESCVAAQHIDDAGEMNGYLKPTDHLLANPPRFEGGAMWLPAGIATDKLRLLWSPEQIAGWLKHAYPHNESHRVSHETIYRSLFIQARCALMKELLQHLRRTRGMRRSRHHTQRTDVHGRIVGAVSISERPASADDRAVPGHWEGDLMFGAHNSRIATLVERQARYVMLAKVASKDTETVVAVLIKNARKLPQELYRSLTWDRGSEMADHRRFTLATDVQCLLL
jgi:IS30 family transposase